MKRKMKVIFAGTAIAMGALLAACNSGAEKEGKDLAQAEEKALEAVDEARSEIAAPSDTTKVADAKEELLEVNQELNEKQSKYLESLKKQEVKLQENITKVDEKLRSADGNSKKRLTEKKDKLTKERDMLQANMLELTKPMEDKRLATVQKEVQERIVAIEKVLSEK
ncbi:hypothetical protein [Dyadobacter sp. CY323]|uniref:hypothetical protein n=1 Tax=Dyadobacter sp. CY323 TaxID=2907302 RepID=UPI001F1AD635|nr:hypothetical protein [Dyadobacter sp. CY323]MCE6990825.1 hypothetical protein [Dyadobacter sp. CY323]